MASPETNDAQHLVDLGRALSDNIETYLHALGNSGLPAPSFRPGATAAIPPDPLGTEAHRAIISTAERILALATGPAELYHLSRQCLETTAVRIVVELNLPSILPLEQPLTARQLAAATGADESVIARIMRVLTPLFIFEEVAPQTYRHTARSASMRERGVAALMVFGGAECMRAAAYLPETLKDAGYREVAEPGQTAFCRAYGTELGFFNYINKHAEMSKRFNDAMAGTMNLSYENGSVVDAFPFDRLAQYGGKIVDVGGGKGHMMVSIAQRYPDADLQFVVQDFAAVVDAGRDDCPADLRHKFEWVALDFLAGDQPVKHAAAYFMRHIMHNWADPYCVQILKPIVAAMKPGVSRLLVADMVVPEMNAPKDLAHRDLLMMAQLAGMERTEGHFVRLLKEVHSAVELEKVWSLPSSAPGCGVRVLEFVLRS